MTTIHLNNIIVKKTIDTTTYSPPNSVVKIINIHGLVLNELPQPIKLNSKLFKSNIYLHATPKYIKK